MSSSLNGVHRDDRRLRLLIFAPHFAELALRFGQAMAAHAEVMVLVEGGNLVAECGDRGPALAPAVRIYTIRGNGFRAQLAALLAALLRFRPSLVQVEETTHRRLSQLVRIARIFAPVVMRVHDVETHSGADSNLSAERRANRDRLRRSVDCVLVHGPTSRAAFTARYKTVAIETRHGVIGAPVHAALRAPEPCRLLMFGRMEEYKGLDILVAALELLDARGVNVRATIAGRGPELSRLTDRLAKLPNVTLLDRFILAEEVPTLFQAAQFALLPYKDATQSGVAAMAFANGRPVIASRVGGLPDLIENGINGLLVPPANPQALVDAIERAVTEPGLAQRLSEGARRTAKLLDWDSIALELAVPFRRLAK